jgi:hemoglobin-like flavoprotein
VTAAPASARQTSDHRLLAESLDLITPVAGELVVSFYEQLFAEHPEVRPMFPPDMSAQNDKLLRAVIALVTHYGEPDKLVPGLEAMGRRHAGYGVTDGHYCAVGLTLLATLRRFAGPAWTTEYEGAWVRAYTFAAGTMMAAPAVQARPWWWRIHRAGGAS